MSTTARFEYNAAIVLPFLGFDDAQNEQIGHPSLCVTGG
jgi:hypothetical protein